MRPHGHCSSPVLQLMVQQGRGRNTSPIQEQSQSSDSNQPAKILSPQTSPQSQGWSGGSSKEVRSARPGGAWHNKRWAQTHLKCNFSKDQGQKPDLKCSLEDTGQKPQNKAFSRSFSCSSFSQSGCFHSSSTRGSTAAWH